MGNIGALYYDIFHNFYLSKNGLLRRPSPLCEILLMINLAQTLLESSNIIDIEIGNVKETGQKRRIISMHES